jgi:ribosomal protein S18 acetylase RimI-like enzyme
VLYRVYLQSRQDEVCLEIIMELRIRHADDHDGQLITDFTQAALQDMESAGGDQINHDKIFWKMYAENIVESIRQGARLYLLAQTDHRIVGFLEGKIVKPHEVFIHQEIFHISIVYVIPESRRQGIATALVQEALEWAWDQGCREADLNVLFTNEKARQLYKKLGFNVFQYQLRNRLPAKA